jgi:hypothetical protein
MDQKCADHLRSIHSNALSPIAKMGNSSSQVLNPTAYDKSLHGRGETSCQSIDAYRKVMIDEQDQVVYQKRLPNDLLMGDPALGLLLTAVVCLDRDCQLI